MASTPLTICNAALVKLGAKLLTSFNDDRKEAELCKMRYPVIRDSVLRGHIWVFAKQAIRLTYPSPAPIKPWTLAYELPDDLGRILSIVDDGGGENPYELMGRQILTDTKPINLRYITRYDVVDDKQQFPDDFAEAVTCLLASDICVSLTQTVSLRETYLQEYLMNISTARFNGAVEIYPEAMTATGWLEARQGLSSTDPYPTLLA